VPTVKLSTENNTDRYYAPEQSAPEELIYTETGDREFLLATPSTEIRLSCREDAVFICSLVNPKNGYEWLSEETAVRLPDSTQRYTSGKLSESVPLTWKLVSVGEAAASDGARWLKFTYENAEPALVLEDFWIVTATDGPIQHGMYLYNRSLCDCLVYAQQSLDVPLKAETEPDVWRFHKENFSADPLGTYCGTLKEGETVSAVTTAIVDVDGTCGFVPCLVFDAAEEHGCYVCWEWPDGRVTAERKNGAIRVRAGVQDDFRTKIEKNNRYYVPIAYIGTYTGDVDDGTNRMKNWFMNEKVPSALMTDENEPQTQVGFYLSPAEHDFSAMGIRSMKLDYGWWADSEGIWIPNEQDVLKKIKTYGPNDLSEYGAWLKEKNIGFTLYILLHDAHKDGQDILTSVGMNGHPEWFTDVKASASESADLGDASCVAFLKNKLYRTFTEYNATTWRTDMEPISWSSLYDNRHIFGRTDTTYWNAAGFYEILDYLFDTIPGFRYENCGSGGAYKDFATMSRSMVVQLEDRANVSNIRKTFYTSSYMFSPLTLGCVASPDTFNPNTDSYKGYDFDFGMRTCIMGVPMICVWQGARGGHYLYDFEDCVSYYFNLYCDRVVPIQRGGSTYHILPRPDDVHWDGMEFYNETSGDGVVFLFKPTDTEGSTKTIFLDGLDPAAEYRLTFEDDSSSDCVMTGAALMESGIPVTIGGEFGSEMIWLSRK
jgi:hypothetical protein